MVTSMNGVNRKSKKEILKQKARQQRYRNFDSLTPRQIQVTKLLLDGYKYTEIAHELWISVNTARNHVQKIYKILGVRGRWGLKSILSKHEIDLIQNKYGVTSE